MSNYQKFTLDTIKQRLKEGAYASLSGANRAIGKVQELSSSDKEKAKALAAKHFGTASDEPKASKESKKVAKAAKPVKTGKAGRPAKVAKKSKSLVSKPKETKTASPAPVKKVAKRGRKAAKKTAAKASADTSEHAPVETQQETQPSLPSGTGEVVEMFTAIVSTTAKALDSMQTAKHLFPKAGLEHGVEAAGSSIAKAIKILDQRILSQMLLPENVIAAPSSLIPAATVAQEAQDTSESSKGNGSSEPVWAVPPILDNVEHEQETRAVSS